MVLTSTNFPGVQQLCKTRVYFKGVAHGEGYTQLCCRNKLAWKSWSLTQQSLFFVYAQSPSSVGSGLCSWLTRACPQLCQSDVEGTCPFSVLLPHKWGLFHRPMARTKIQSLQSTEVYGTRSRKKSSRYSIQGNATCGIWVIAWWYLYWFAWAPVTCLLTLHMNTSICFVC